MTSYKTELETVDVLVCKFDSQRGFAGQLVTPAGLSELESLSAAMSLVT